MKINFGSTKKSMPITHRNYLTYLVFEYSQISMQDLTPFQKSQHQEAKQNLILPEPPKIKFC